MAKLNNNPDGKKGGKKHQDLQEELFIEMTKQFAGMSPAEGELKIDKEAFIPTYGGKKPFRVADAAAVIVSSVQNTITFVWLRIVQVGKTDKQGKPVARELEAIADIEKATGTPVEFYDYETNKKIR